MQSDRVIRIIEIGEELEKLASSGVFTQRTTDACAKGASLLIQMRNVIAATWKSNTPLLSDADALTKLRKILDDQHEG